MYVQGIGFERALVARDRRVVLFEQMVERRDLVGAFCFAERVVGFRERDAAPKHVAATLAVARDVEIRPKHAREDAVVRVVFEKLLGVSITGSGSPGNYSLMRDSRQHTIQGNPGSAMHRHSASFCQLQQLPQTFMPRALGDHNLFKSLIANPKSFEHRNQSIDGIGRIGIGGHLSAVRIVSQKR